jgi:hypothetical protein
MWCPFVFRIDTVPPFVTVCKLQVYDLLFIPLIYMYIQPDDGFFVPPKHVAEILKLIE